MALLDWADSDLPACLTALAERAADPDADIDVAVGVLARHLAAKHPQTALLLGLSTSQSNLRVAACARIAQDWFLKDPEGYRTFLATTNYEPEDRPILYEAFAAQGASYLGSSPPPRVARVGD